MVAPVQQDRGTYSKNEPELTNQMNCLEQLECKMLAGVDIQISIIPDEQVLVSEGAARFNFRTSQSSKEVGRTCQKSQSIIVQQPLIPSATPYQPLQTMNLSSQVDTNASVHEEHHALTDAVTNTEIW